MESDEVSLNICTHFIEQNYGERGENMRGKCCKMEAHLELLINELKSSQLMIKMLQEEIKLASTGPRNQDNLTNCGEYKSHDELHPTNEKDRAWKEIQSTRAMAVKHKGTAAQIKWLQTHSHYHLIVMTLCVLIRKVTIPQLAQKNRGWQSPNT
jgi:hypothetical protein